MASDEILKGLIETAVEKLKDLKIGDKIDDFVKDVLEKPVHFAVCGETGCGKSEFTRQFFSLDDSNGPVSGPGVDDRSAEPKTFFHPNFPFMKITDIPGVGYGDYAISVDKYWSHQKLNFKQYDAFALMSSNMFKHQEMELYKRIRETKKPVFLVFSHFDIFVEKQNKYRGRRNQQPLTESENKREQRRYFEQQFPNDSDVKLYFVDNTKTAEFDFQDLVSDLQNSLEKLQRWNAISMIFFPSQKALEKQAAGMKEQAFLISLCSAAAGAIPIPGADMAIDAVLITSVFNRYKKAFHLDLDAVRKLCRDFKVPEEEADKILTKTKHIKLGGLKQLLFTSDGIAILAKTLAIAGVMTALKSSDDIVKALSITGIRVIATAFGCAIGMPIGYFTTLTILRRLIDTLHEDAKMVLTELETYYKN